MPFASRSAVPDSVKKHWPHTTLSLLLMLPVTSMAQTASDQALRLSPLVVSASGFEQDIKEAPASISVITREELEDRRVTSLTDALRDVEGIDVMSSAGKTGGHDIRMRGMPSEYTLILIDGRRQNAAGNVTPNGFGETQTSFMPPVEAIERIEVIRGPMSTLYGSDAMGGVINIITRKVPQQWSGSATLEGTFNQDSDYGDSRALELYTSGPLVQELIGLQLRGRVFERDASNLSFRDDNGDPLEVSKRGPSPVEADIYSLGGRLTLTPDKDNDLWLDAEQSRQKYNNDKAQLGTLDNPSGRIQGYGDTLRFEREQIAIGHTGRFSTGTLESSLMRNTTETIGRTIPGGSAGGDYGQPFPGFPDMIIGSARELKSTSLVLDSKFIAPIGDHALTVGGQWLDAEMIDGLATGKFKQTTWALFAEDEWYLRDDLALTLGGRYDHHDSFGGQVSPRAYLVWNTTERWTLKGGVSRGYRTPSLNDLHEGINGVTGQDTIITIGSPDLKPEISTSSELAIQYGLPNGFMGSATIFHNNFDDKIAAGPDVIVTGNPNIPDGTYSQKVNVDKAVTQGLELATRIPLTQALSLAANYTYTDSEQKSGADKGNPLTDTPKHLINANLRWQTTERLSSWLRGEYSSERYRARTRVRGAPSYSDLGDFKAYTLFHLGGSYQATTNLTLHATIYNLMDKDFVDYQAYDVNGTTTYGNVYANSEPGRRLWVSANLRF